MPRLMIEVHLNLDAKSSLTEALYQPDFAENHFGYWTLKQSALCRQ